MVAERLIQDFHGFFRNFIGIEMDGFFLAMESPMAVFVYSSCCLSDLYLVEAVI